MPTRDKVVFLAVDAGAARDPRFVRMTGELSLPVSLFRAEGRPDLPTLSYEGQCAEICGQRGSRLLHPPHGAYNADTLRAAADCRVRAVVLGRESGEYALGERLRPGDIVRADARATGAAAPYPGTGVCGGATGGLRLTRRRPGGGTLASAAALSVPGPHRGAPVNWHSA